MWAWALVVAAVWAADARAVEFKNVRATYGPFGAARPTNKILPGEVYVLSFDVAGLTIDAKGVAKYTITLDVFDPKGKQIVPDKARVSKKAVVAGLGGNTIPELAHVVIGVDQPIGKYKVVVTVEEEKEKGKGTKQSFTQEVEVLAQDFGMIHVVAQSYGFVGQDYACQFSLVGWKRDDKKLPNMVVTSKVLDEQGKQIGDPVVTNIPKDFGPDFNWEKQELVPMQSTILLNRAGKYTVVVEARDELAKKTVKLTYDLKVIDTGK
jgi:hypothetical protein